MDVCWPGCQLLADVHIQRRRPAPVEALHDRNERLSRRDDHRRERTDLTSASFTLANASQCQGGSPRFNVVTNVTTFFLGCNNVTPTINANGTATYLFTAATIAAAGKQVPVRPERSRR